MQRNELHGERIMMNRRTLPVLLAGLMIFLAASAFAGVGLRDGVVVDTARSVAYVMHPQGGIQALNLRNGNVLWHSREAERPLAVAGNRLVAQALPKNGELRIVALDVRGGALTATAGHPMPEGVQAGVAESLQQAFHLTAMPSEDGVVLTWEVEELSGLPKRRDQRLGSPERIEAESRASRQGTALFDPSTGRLSKVAARQMARPAVARSLSAPSSVEARFSSADGRHVLTSRLVDDAAALPYRWTISDAKTGAVLGTLRAEASMSPFAVAGTRLVHIAQPTLRMEGDKLVERPLRLRAVDLTTGREAWHREILDTAWRGPVPN